MGISLPSDASGVPIARYYSSSTWIEGSALDQLQQTAHLPGMRRAAAFPDLHPGRGIPVGAAFLSSGVFYPHLIGNDIGCGIGLWKTGLDARKPKVERWLSRLAGLDHPQDPTPASFLEAHGLDPKDDDPSLGTLGGGNHFAELTRVLRVVDRPAFEASGLDPRELHLLIHTGSRGLGDLLFRAHAAAHGASPLPASSEAGRRYLAEHDRLQRWARANRHRVAQRFLDALGGEEARVCDTVHNGLSAVDGGWLHRKGAAQADGGALVIAGSRGTSSFLVQPLHPDAASLWSLAHGAGRKLPRAEMRSRLSARFRPEQLRRPECGNHVLCQDRDLLYEEAPQAYKDISRVIADLEAFGLVTVIAELTPLITYKCG